MFLQFQTHQIDNGPTLRTAIIQTPRIRIDIAIYETVEEGQPAFYTGWNLDPTLNCGRGPKFASIPDIIAHVEDEALDALVTAIEPPTWTTVGYGLTTNINGFELEITRAFGSKKAYDVLFEKSVYVGPELTSIEAAKFVALRFALKKLIGAMNVLGLGSSPSIPVLQYKTGA